MNIHLIKHSIRWKLLFIVMCLVVSLLVIMTTIQITTQANILQDELAIRKKLMKEHLILYANVISKNLGVEIEKAFSPFQYLKIDHLLQKRIGEDADLIYGILMSTGQKVLIHTRNRGLEQEVIETDCAFLAAQKKGLSKQEYKLDAMNILEIILPIKLRGAQWGVLRLGFSLSTLEKRINNSEEENALRIRHMMIKSSLISMGFLVFSFAILAWFLERVSKPLSDLTKVAHQLALGDFTPVKSLSIKTNDEIEILATTLIEMSENLKNSYEKLENYSYDLEAQVAKRTIELADVRDQALAANEAKSKFVATVSHEIRNPMHAIINTTELLLKTPLDDKQKNHLNNVVNVSNMLVFLINDLLDVAKIEAGKLEIERISLSLSDVLNDIENLTQVRAKKKGLDLQFSLDKNIPLLLMGDPLRLKQILLNLVTNAIKFTTKGEILVSIELLNIKPKQVSLKFCVSDTGIGLRSDEINLLFQSFTQADKTIARKHGGTGLGLVICKQLVELMGGKIKVDSLWGRGSQFYFTLDVKLEPQVYMNKRTLPEKFRETKVLVVDDDEISRTVLQTYLESFGFLVNNVNSGKQALRLLENLEETTYGLVLMDWEMPGYDGVETSKKIKLSLRIDPTPPIIMVTSRTQEEVLPLIRDEIRAVLSKPVDPLDLLAHIGTVLDFSLPEYSHPVMETSVNKVIDLTGARILVVDDDDINRLIVKEMLENEKLVVVAANGGQQAIEKINEQTFDAVLMDLQMPGMDGYETCVKIRRNPKHKNLPIIALSGHAMSEIRDKCFQVGMNDYVSKPFKFQSLLKILDRIITSKIGNNSMSIAENAAFIRIKAIQPFACLSGIDVDLVLERISGKTELLKKLLFSFAYDFNDMTSRIEDALIEGNQQEAQRLIHSLKGVSGNLSALPLYESAKQLEHAIIHEPQNFPAALIKCEKALKTLVDSIHKLPR